MAGDALTFRVAFVVRWLLWVVRFVVIWPLATMVLMALFVLWKDNTTPGKLLVKEINFVRQTAPAGQFPVSECWFSSSDSSGRSEIQDICHYRAADAADYVRVTIARDKALKSQITKLLTSIQNKAVSDTPLDDREKGFISSTT
ncbi:conjugal transfer pilus-stabilizing protein TraP, partial [Escherichia coli]